MRKQGLDIRLLGEEVRQNAVLRQENWRRAPKIVLPNCWYCVSAEVIVVGWGDANSPHLITTPSGCRRLHYLQRICCSRNGF